MVDLKENRLGPDVDQWEREPGAGAARHRANIGRPWAAVKGGSRKRDRRPGVQAATICRTVECAKERAAATEVDTMIRTAVAKLKGVEPQQVRIGRKWDKLSFAIDMHGPKARAGAVKL